MLHKLLYGLHDFYSPLNVFRYITFRTALAVITAMLLTLFIGPRIITWLKKISITQQIRDDGPKTHLKKSGTPTMGGIIIIICSVLTILMWGDIENMYVWIMVVSLIGYGGIGLLDDYLKVIRKIRRA
jgi:phospho-N-acetylmuramoyl-pentapeptide-transferase